MTHKSPGERIAYSNDPETKCGGEQTFGECETAQELYAKNRGFYTERILRAGNGSYNNLFFTKTICEACGYLCMISFEIENGMSTDNARIICRQNTDEAQNTTPA